MGKSTGKKPKAALASVNDPTPERTMRDEFATVPAPRMMDERIGRDRLADARKRVCRIKLMEKDRWINSAQAAALERYELLIEQSAYGGTKSCIDMTARGGGGPEAVVDLLAASRRLLARAQNAVTDQVALIFVNAILAPYGTESRGDVVDRLLGGRRDEAVLRIRGVAGDLAAHFGA